MPWFHRYFPQFKLEKVNEKPGGGGSGKNKETDDADDTDDDDSDDDDGETLESLRAKLVAQSKRIKKLKARSAPVDDDDDDSDDDDLSAKLQKKKKEDEKKTGDVKQLEAAIRFSERSKEWLDTNKALLPKGIATIFELAASETYENPIEKDAAIKSGIIKEFFSLQENVELLTDSQKGLLDHFLKLTKNAKQERAQSFYDSIFEPTFEMLKKLEKAKQVNNGRNENKGEDAYKQRLIENSRKQYLGVTK